MSEPIELIKGNSRTTVYSDVKARPLEADGWQRVKNLTPEQQARLADLPPSPFAGYDDMTVEEVLAKSEGLTPERIKEVITYESATKGRVSIVNKLTGQQPNKGTWATNEPAQPPVTVEKELEAETGHDVVKTGDNPPTFVETDKPAPSKSAGSKSK